MKSRSLDDDDVRAKRKLNMQKAQSGAMAEAVLDTVKSKRQLADTATDLTDQERDWLRTEAAVTERRAKRQLSCARRSKLTVRDIAPGISERVFVRRGFGCGRPLCMICAAQKAQRLRQQLLTAYDRAHERMPGIRALELVLTQPASPLDRLGDGIDRLHHGIRRLLRTPQFTSAIVGSYRRTEITFNRDKQTAHIHSHLCLIVPPTYFDGGQYLTHDLLTRLWADILGIEDFVNVSIRAVGLRDAAGRLIPNTERQGLWHTSKYITKPASIFERTDPETNRYHLPTDVAAAFEAALFGRRMHAFAGILKSRWKPTPSTPSRSPEAASTASGGSLPSASPPKVRPTRQSRKDNR